MAQRKTGTVVEKELVAPALMRFRLMPEADSRFPDYEAGQYIALRRDDAKLTRKLGVAQDGKPIFEPELDPWGRQTIGSITHSYSIASAPAETAEHGWLEFFVALEYGLHGLPGRLSDALFGMGKETGCEVIYHDRTAGSFTLPARTDGAESVFLVGTGTGIAPFVSMVKQLHAQDGGGDGRRYTLLHTSRTVAELGYHEALFEIEASGRFDFMYVPTISRPAQEAALDKRIGQGRATNVVRHILDLPNAEEDKLTNAAGEVARMAGNLALERLVPPVLPSHLTVKTLAERLDPASTVVLTVGNPASMADIKATAARRQIRFEMEEW
jgi:ferredoxin-NADP reductase